MSDRNETFREWARAARRTYDEISGGGLEDWALTPLLIASLLHLADREPGPGAEDLMADAWDIYSRERDDMD